MVTSSSVPEAESKGSSGRERVRVLYIGGTGRTGSTLLTSILGQFPQFFAAGELAYLWRFGFLSEGKCGCGERIRDCELWTAVFADAFGGAAQVDAAELVRLRRRFNSRHLPLMVTRGMRQRLLKRSGVFPSTAERLYHGVASATGSRVIVDSSKEPHYSYILRSRPSLDVYFLHLVRDPRAVAHSWKDHRKREAGLSDDTLMETRGVVASAVYFDVSNLAAELMWRRSDRYMFLRYEDFMADPAGVMVEIGRFVGEDIDPGQVITDRTVELRTCHTAWGNPNRFERGSVRLFSEETWRSSMSRHRQLAMTALTLPLVKRYHYPVMPTAPTGSRG